MSKKLDDLVKDKNDKFLTNIKDAISDRRENNPEEFIEEEDTQYKPLNVAYISGKLIYKKTAEGTKSEGVIYFILPNDSYKTKYAEVLVRKKTHLWQDDPQLHPFIDKFVKIKGDIIETRSSITVDCIEIEEISKNN